MFLWKGELCLRRYLNTCLPLHEGGGASMKGPALTTTATAPARRPNWDADSYSKTFLFG